MSDLYSVLQDFIRILEQQQLAFAVMGGIAAHVHGVPRPTHDLDFTIAVDSSQLQAFFDGLEEEGYTVAENYRGGWVDRVGDMPLVKVKIYLQGHGVDVDLFLVENKFQEELMTRRQRAEVNDVRIWVVSPEDLILLKLIAHRTRDLSDIGDVLFMQGQHDLAYLRKWAKYLQVSDRLEKALADGGSH